MENFNLYDAKKQFLLAIQEVGIPAPEVLIGDGRLHRFATGGRRLDQNGWYVFFSDRNPAGSFGCWKRGISETWHAGQKNSLTPSRSRAISRQAEQARFQRQQAAVTQQKTAAERAKQLWNSCSPAPSSHPYLTRKLIEPNGARIAKTNCLVLPILDFDQRLCSIQFISESGQKKLFPGARKKGCFIPVSVPEDPQNEDMPLAIVEGFATGATVSKDNPDLCVIAAIDAGNLKNVCIGARLLWLDRPITIFADDDRQSSMNVGRTKAIQAGTVAGCEVKFPDFPPDAPDHLSDFNDLHCWLARGSANE